MYLCRLWGTLALVRKVNRSEQSPGLGWTVEEALSSSNPTQHFLESPRSLQQLGLWEAWTSLYPPWLNILLLWPHLLRSSTRAQHKHLAAATTRPENLGSTFIIGFVFN